MNQKQVQQARKQNALRQSHERSHEKSGSKVEQAIINFTRIPERLLEAVLSSFTGGSAETTQSAETDTPKNYTDLNEPDVKQRLESHMDLQDNKESSIADIRKQLSFLRQEESDARHSINKEKHERQQALAEEDKQKAEEEQRKNARPAEAPTAKQKRGVMGQKRKKTVETSAAFGKQ